MSSKRIRTLAIVLIPFLLSPQRVWAEKYYQPSKKCVGPIKAIDRQPVNPLRYLSMTAPDQKGPSCGYHAGTALLEALVNLNLSSKSSHRDRSPIGLSVVHAMEQLGVCTLEQVDSTPIN